MNKLNRASIRQDAGTCQHLAPFKYGTSGCSASPSVEKESMKEITIKWGTDKDKTKTYTFKNDEELKFFMMGVDEANGWLEYEIKE